MLGLSHIGVLEALDENGIRPGLVTGTSAGGFVAALYAAGASPADMRQMALEMKREDLFESNFTTGTFLLMLLRFFKDMMEVMYLLPRGLLSGLRIRDYVDNFAGKQNIAQVTMPLGLVAVDLISGNRVVFTNRAPVEQLPGTLFVREAPLGLAVQATTAIPGVFEPVAFKGMLLVDGGVAETVPALLARQMGARVVTAVNLIERNVVAEPRGILQVILRSVAVMTQQVGQYNLAMADLVIHPPVVHADLGDFSQTLKLIEGGRRAALESLPALYELVRTRGGGQESDVRTEFGGRESEV
jgi:NTE family protein